MTPTDRATRLAGLKCQACKGLRCIEGENIFGKLVPVADCKPCHGTSYVLGPSVRVPCNLGLDLPKAAFPAWDHRVPLCPKCQGRVWTPSPDPEAWQKALEQTEWRAARLKGLDAVQWVILREEGAGTEDGLLVGGSTHSEALLDAVEIVLRDEVQP